jgi:hypothetical protein
MLQSEPTSRYIATASAESQPDSGVSPLCARRVVVDSAHVPRLPSQLHAFGRHCACRGLGRDAFAVLTGQAAAVDTCAPAPPRTLAVIAHGFTRSRGSACHARRALGRGGLSRCRARSAAFGAARGELRRFVALVAAIMGRRTLYTLPVVLIGASADGLAALLATDRVPRLALWIGLDPVDAFGQSRGVARNLRVPAMGLRAPSGMQRRRQRAADRRPAANGTWNSASTVPHAVISRTAPGPALRRCSTRCGTSRSTMRRAPTAWYSGTNASAEARRPRVTGWPGPTSPTRA